MHGERGQGHPESDDRLRRSTNRRMCTRAAKSVVGAGGSHLPSSSSPSFIVANSFFKDGRKISVGDCALFKPPQDSPPFIGIICSLTAGEDTKLGVNWLYRLSEVKLGKGIQLEAAPNEVFYSFHKDEILAASLLHPCKVAFLPKGVELPPGVSSFVCRRVFDIANKCLWWLTDRDFIDDRQQEVDQLLYKTPIEMHATMHPGGRSPKPINGPTSTSQLKSSDGIPNVSSFPAVKGKKRERGDQGSEPMKRASKMDDGDSGQARPENNLKTEISKITDRGGLVDSEGVEKLVELMAEKVEKKIDLFGRSLLAGVIAATDKFDCLSQFVKQSGLTVFDDWLQEFHKGKIGNVNSHKEGDKSVEEFLLVLLRALDKLPVNLNALQKCNIGKSVNHLRSHKNLEIQKKARSLVDTWKKRVEAEMNINDAKSGSNQAVSWPGRTRVSDGSHSGNRHSGASEVAVKSTITQLTVSKTVSVKPAQSDVIVKSASASPSLGSTKSALSPTTNLKDAQLRSAVGGGSSDIPPARDEKSSSSSQSHNSQSCSSDHVKNVGSSAKDDARSSTAGSMSVSKLSAGASRSKKSISALPCPASNAVQREGVSSRSPSVNRNIASEKLPQSSEKALDTPTADGNSHKLIVKIPNRGRSPAQSVSGGSFDEPSLMSSRASSPARSEKQEQCDRNQTVKSDHCRTKFVSDVKSESWQSNDFKDVLTGSEEGDGSPAAILDEGHCGTGEDSKKMAETSKAASSSSGNELKSGKMHEVSYSSMEALVASCVKHSETNSSVPIADDGAMNLLASVATDSTLHTISPQKSPAVEDMCPVNHSNLSKGSDNPGEPTQANVCPDDDDNIVKQVVLSQEKEAIQQDECKSSTRNVQEIADQMECIETVVETAASASDVPPSMDAVEKNSEEVDDAPEQLKEVIRLSADGVSDNIKAIHVLEKEGSINEKTGRNAAEGLTSVSRKEADDGLLLHSGSGEEVGGKIQKGEIKEMETSCHTDKHRVELKTSSLPMNKDQTIAGGLGSSVADSRKGFLEENLETDETPECCSVSPYKGPQQYPAEDKSDECTSTAADAASTAAGHDTDEKLEFDLNEGFSADEGKYGEANSTTPSSGAAHLVNPLPFPLSSVSSSIPASVTVTAAAKGPFVPPDNLLRNKGEIGWKGSAATSAFRPAEPRKVLDLAMNGTNASLSAGSSNKNGRPLLDIDLNVPDERILEDMAASQNGVGVIDHDTMRRESMSAGPARSSGGLDLDLNRADEVPDLGQYFAGSNLKLVARRLMPEKVSPPRSCSNREPSVQRDFDLNDGPLVDEAHSEQSALGQQARSSLPFHAPGTGLRMKNTDIGNFSSWFPPANVYPQVAIPPVFSDRGEQPFSLAAPGGSQRILTGPASVSPFNADVYRGPVLSSSPAVPFPSAPFQYPVFSFATNFPLPSAALTGATNYMDTSSSGRHYFSAVNSQLVGPAGAVASFQRPCVINIPDGNADAGFDANRRRGRQSLDLNAGPGGLEIEGRDPVSLFASRQPSVPNSQAIMEEQERIYHASGGVKRKEPEGGWEAERYKQSSWH